MWLVDSFKMLTYWYIEMENLRPNLIFWNLKKVDPLQRYLYIYLYIKSDSPPSPPLFHVAPHYKDWKTKRKHTSKGWLYWDMIKGFTRKAPPFDQDSNTGSAIMPTKLNIYDGSYSLYALWFYCSQKTIKLFGFTICWLWDECCPCAHN